MSITTQQTELFCLKCNKDTLHEITYVSHKISNIACLECKRHIQINDDTVISHYLEDILHRLLTKPERVGQEIKHDHGKSLLGLPVRFFKKIINVGKDLKEFIQYLKKRPHDGT